MVYNFYFEIQRAPSEAAAQAKNICPEGLNWPGQLAYISEGASEIWKKINRTTFHHHFYFRNDNFKSLDGVIMDIIYQ